MSGASDSSSDSSNDDTDDDHGDDQGSDSDAFDLSNSSCLCTHCQKTFPDHKTLAEHLQSIMNENNRLKKRKSNSTAESNHMKRQKVNSTSGERRERRNSSPVTSTATDNEDRRERNKTKKNKQKPSAASKIKAHIKLIASYLKKNPVKIQPLLNILNLNNVIYRCNQCNIHMIQREEYRTHLKKHDDRKFNCNDCKLDFTLASMRKHLKVHETSGMTAQDFNIVDGGLSSSDSESDDTVTTSGGTKANEKGSDNGNNNAKTSRNVSDESRRKKEHSVNRKNIQPNQTQSARPSNSQKDGNRESNPKRITIELHVCTYCGLHFLGEPHLKSHHSKVKTVDDHKDKGKKGNNCKFCKLKFSTSTLRMHIKEHHSNTNANITDYHIIRHTWSPTSAMLTQSEHNSTENSNNRSQNVNKPIAAPRVRFCIDNECSVKSPNTAAENAKTSEKNPKVSVSSGNKNGNTQKLTNLNDNRPKESARNSADSQNPANARENTVQANDLRNKVENNVNTKKTNTIPVIAPRSSPSVNSAATTKEPRVTEKNTSLNDKAVASACKDPAATHGHIKTGGKSVPEAPKSSNPNFKESNPIMPIPMHNKEMEHLAKTQNTTNATEKPIMPQNTTNATEKPIIPIQSPVRLEERQTYESSSQSSESREESASRNNIIVTCTNLAQNKSDNTTVNNTTVTNTTVNNATVNNTAVNNTTVNNATVNNTTVTNTASFENSQDNADKETRFAATLSENSDVCKDSITTVPVPVVTSTIGTNFRLDNETVRDNSTTEVSVNVDTSRESVIILSGSSKHEATTSSMTNKHTATENRPNDSVTSSKSAIQQLITSFLANDSNSGTNFTTMSLKKDSNSDSTENNIKLEQNIKNPMSTETDNNLSTVQIVDVLGNVIFESIKSEESLKTSVLGSVKFEIVDEQLQDDIVKGSYSEFIGFEDVKPGSITIEGVIPKSEPKTEDVGMFNNSVENCGESIENEENIDLNHQLANQEFICPSGTEALHIEIDLKMETGHANFKEEDEDETKELMYPVINNVKTENAWSENILLPIETPEIEDEIKKERSDLEVETGNENLKEDFEELTYPVIDNIKSENAWSENILLPTETSDIGDEIKKERSDLEVETGDENFKKEEYFEEWTYPVIDCIKNENALIENILLPMKTPDIEDEIKKERSDLEAETGDGNFTEEYSEELTCPGTDGIKSENALSENILLPMETPDIKDEIKKERSDLEMETGDENFKEEKDVEELTYPGTDGIKSENALSEDFEELAYLVTDDIKSKNALSEDILLQTTEIKDEIKEEERSDSQNTVILVSDTEDDVVNENNNMSLEDNMNDHSELSQEYFKKSKNIDTAQAQEVDLETPLDLRQIKAKHTVDTDKNFQKGEKNTSNNPKTVKIQSPVLDAMSTPEEVIQSGDEEALLASEEEEEYEYIPPIRLSSAQRENLSQMVGFECDDPFNQEQFAAKISNCQTYDLDGKNDEMNSNYTTTKQAVNPCELLPEDTEEQFNDNQTLHLASPSKDAEPTNIDDILTKENDQILAENETHGIQNKKIAGSNLETYDNDSQDTIRYDLQEEDLTKETSLQIDTNFNIDLYNDNMDDNINENQHIDNVYESQSRAEQIIDDNNENVSGEGGGTDDKTNLVQTKSKEVTQESSTKNISDVDLITRAMREFDINIVINDDEKMQSENIEEITTSNIDENKISGIDNLQANIEFSYAENCEKDTVPANCDESIHNSYIEEVNKIAKESSRITINSKDTVIEEEINTETDQDTIVNEEIESQILSPPDIGFNENNHVKEKSYETEALFTEPSTEKSTLNEENTSGEINIDVIINEEINQNNEYEMRIDSDHMVTNIIQEPVILNEHTSPNQMLSTDDDNDTDLKTGEAKKNTIELKEIKKEPVFFTNESIKDTLKNIDPSQITSIEIDLSSDDEGNEETNKEEDLHSEIITRISECRSLLEKLVNDKGEDETIRESEETDRTVLNQSIEDFGTSQDKNEVDLSRSLDDKSDAADVVFIKQEPREIIATIDLDKFDDGEIIVIDSDDDEVMFIKQTKNDANEEEIVKNVIREKQRKRHD